MSCVFGTGEAISRRIALVQTACVPNMTGTPVVTTPAKYQDHHGGDSHHGQHHHGGHQRDGYHTATGVAVNTPATATITKTTPPRRQCRRKCGCGEPVMLSGWPPDKFTFTPWATWLQCRLSGSFADQPTSGAYRC